MHIIQVEYENEAERKKIEYIASQWQRSTRRPKGYIIFVDDGEFESVFKAIAAKFSEDRIETYRLEEIQPEVESKTTSMSFQFRENQKYDQVSAFINYLINRRRGSLISSIGGVLSYRIMTRKATVQVDVTFMSTKPVSLMIEIHGPAEGVSLIGKEFSQELEIFGGMKHGE